MQLTVGMLAQATDGPCREIPDVVIDPVTWRVTHLVVQPHHHHEQARLAPIDAVTSDDADHVTLSWSTKQIEAAAIVEQTDFEPLDSWPQLEDGWDVGLQRVLAWPYYPYTGLTTGGISYPYSYGSGHAWGRPAQVSMIYDRVREGTIEVHRASKVISSDDYIVGHVDGFLVDASGKVTHLVLEHGHLWGHRDITIPLADIKDARTDAVQLSVTRDAIGDYPSVPFDRHGHGHAG